MENTIQVRIRIAIWPNGKWMAYGDDGKHSERTHDEIMEASPGGESYHWVTANVPLPCDIEGTIEVTLDN